MYKENIPERLKSIRTELGFSQKQVEDETEILQSDISKYENGNKEPSMENIAKLASFYDVSVDWLLGIGKKNDNKKN